MCGLVVELHEKVGCFVGPGSQFVVSGCSSCLKEDFVLFILGCFLSKFVMDHEGDAAPFEGFGAKAAFLAGLFSWDR